MDSTVFYVVAILAIAVQALVIYLALFEPTLPYRISEPPDLPLESEEFAAVASTLADARLHRRTTIEVLTNAEAFYEAELAAIAQARTSINLEAYIFHRGRVTGRFVRAMAERARAGVKVNVVLDGFGSIATPNDYFHELCAAGGRIAWYHPIRWQTLPRINNRTHRELIIIDCKVAFAGGAGFADHWLYAQPKEPKWRDTMFRVEGDAVASLQSVFVENWLEASGELLTSDEYFCFGEAESSARTLVVDSAASSGQSTRARILFQFLMASAKKSIDITTPYFLPDKGVRQELVRAMRDRNVRVRIICPGKHMDHLITRRTSRKLYGDLLEAGAEIYEYRPSMIHTKSMVVDGIWSVVGSTNFDHRSFSINDEVNLGACDHKLAARLGEDFAADLPASKLVTLEQWQRRPWTERVYEFLGSLIERQQ